MTGFGGIGSELAWFCEPAGWGAGDAEDDEGREGSGGGWAVSVDGKELTLRPPAKKDYWRRTYYSPLLIKDDGPCLFATVPRGEACTAEVSFSLTPRRQFDQAGIMVRLDSEHWLKTGIEVTRSATAAIASAHSRP